MLTPAHTVIDRLLVRNSLGRTRLNHPHHPEERLLTPAPWTILLH